MVGCLSQRDPLKLWDFICLMLPVRSFGHLTQKKTIDHAICVRLAQARDFVSGRITSSRNQILLWNQIPFQVGLQIITKRGIKKILFIFDKSIKCIKKNMPATYQTTGHQWEFLYGKYWIIILLLLWIWRQANIWHARLENNISLFFARRSR